MRAGVASTAKLSRLLSRLLVFGDDLAQQVELIFVHFHWLEDADALVELGQRDGGLEHARQLRNEVTLHLDHQTGAGGVVEHVTAPRGQTLDAGGGVVECFLIARDLFEPSLGVLLDLRDLEVTFSLDGGHQAVLLQAYLLFDVIGVALYALGVRLEFGRVRAVGGAALLQLLDVAADGRKYALDGGVELLDLVTAVTQHVALVAHDDLTVLAIELELFGRMLLAEDERVDLWESALGAFVMPHRPVAQSIHVDKLVSKDVFFK